METDFLQIAETLTSQSVDQLILCKSGRNSRVYQVICGNTAYALKSYPSSAGDLRDRFGTEVKALKYYQANNNPYTPRLLAVDEGRNIALLEWLEGAPVIAPTIGDMDQAVDFIARTHAAVHNGGEAFALAAEPCLSGADLYQHIVQRLQKLIVLPDLKDYLERELVPLLEQSRMYAESTSFNIPVPRHKQTLIPADFGFHNAMKTADGRVRFIDFEYFGWDDPVRLAADFLLHPGTALDEINFNQFFSGMALTFGTDKDFENRLLHLLPLYGIRWALILLNEFIPERWQARIFAGEMASWQEIKAQQIKKSRIAADKVTVHLKN